MSAELLQTNENSGCGHNGNLLGGHSCSSCEPKMALTFEEQGILDKLRDLKTVARMTISDLNRIEKIRPGKIDPDILSVELERIRLNTKLEELRSSWSDRRSIP